MPGVILVTGGSRGIGAAVCRLAARQGYDVAVNYTSDAAAAETVVAEVRAAGRKAAALQADVSDWAAVARLFDETEAALGPIDALVNSAGTAGTLSSLAEADPEMMRRTIDINVNGTLYCTREAVRRLSTARGGRGGAIVNLSSVASTLGAPGDLVWYAASKGAIDSLTIGIAKEVADQGIRVNAVQPGLIETDIHAAMGDAARTGRMASSVPMRRVGTPEEVAEPILWLLSAAAGYVTGALLRVGGGR